MRFTRFLLWLVIFAVIYYGYQYREVMISKVENLTHGSKHSASELMDIRKNEQQALATKFKQREEAKQVEKANQAVEQKAEAQVKEQEAQAKQQEAQVKQQKTQAVSEPKKNTQGNTPAATSQKEQSSQPKTESGSSNSADLAWMYNKAKQAVIDKEFPTAIQAYHGLLKNNPKQAKVWGELGDVYHMTGDKVKASKAYGNAMILFKKLGDNSMADRLLPYIRSNAPDVAKRLTNF